MLHKNDFSTIFLPLSNTEFNNLLEPNEINRRPLWKGLLLINIDWIDTQIQPFLFIEFLCFTYCRFDT